MENEKWEMEMGQGEWRMGHGAWRMGMVNREWEMGNWE